MSRLSLEQRLRVVVAAVSVFGPREARKLWVELGLPQAGATPRGASQVEMLVALRRQFADFAAARLDAAPGCVVTARTMYNAYVSWCLTNRCVPVAERVFGGNFHRLGIVKLNRRIRVYLDVTLKDDANVSGLQSCLFK